MVRLKTRWLLVRLDVKESILKEVGKVATATADADEYDDDYQKYLASLFPVKKDLTTAIRQSISATLGLAGEGAALDTQVRLWDPASRLVLLRVPRDDCGKVRACLTLWTTHHYQRDRGEASTRMIVASVLSVNGSARTAKRATLLHVRKWYRNRLLLHHHTQNVVSEHQLSQRKFFDKSCRQLQNLMTTIQSID